VRWVPLLTKNDESDEKKWAFDQQKAGGLRCWHRYSTAHVGSRWHSILLDRKVASAEGLIRKWREWDISKNSLWALRRIAVLLPQDKADGSARTMSY
jgi:hypothetical protein